MSSRCREALVVAVLLWGCEKERPKFERATTSGLVQSLDVQTSDLQAGPKTAEPPVRNPFAGNSFALQDGKRLYGWFNCAGCHGAEGGGAIGPPLADREWIYGGDAQHIYLSIVQGRPQGMPSFRGRLSDDDLWKLVAYVQSLGEGEVSAGGS